jgi:acetyl esterase/lipase
LNFSRVFNARVLSVDYRLAPETVFPGGLHDSVAAYLYLTADLGVDPASIIVAGDSAGGGLTLALLLYLRDNDMPLPGGAVLQSPWCDLTKSFRSWEENAVSHSASRYIPCNSASARTR